MKLIPIAVLALTLGACTTIPPENGPPEPEPVPIPAPEPEPGGPMGYPPEDGNLCSSDAAHKYAEPQGASNAKCYKPKAFAEWCKRFQIYGDEGQCAAANGGRK